MNFMKKSFTKWNSLLRSQNAFTTCEWLIYFKILPFILIQKCKIISCYFKNFDQFGYEVQINISYFCREIIFLQARYIYIYIYIYILKEGIEIIQICMLVTSGIYISVTPLLICYLMFFGPLTMVEGSYEVGSVHFSILPSAFLFVWRFSWNWCIIFFWNSAWC